MAILLLPVFAIALLVFVAYMGNKVTDVPSTPVTTETEKDFVVPAFAIVLTDAEVRKLEGVEEVETEQTIGIPMVGGWDVSGTVWHD